MRGRAIKNGAKGAKLKPRALRLTPAQRQLAAQELIAHSLASIAQTARDFHSIMYPTVEAPPDAEIYHRDDPHPPAETPQDYARAEEGPGRFSQLISRAQRTRARE